MAGMTEIELGPQHGLKQAVDYPLTLLLGPEWGLSAAHSAHMSIRARLEDAAPLARLSTTNDAIALTAVEGGGVRVVIRIDGDLTRVWTVKPSSVTINGLPYKVLKTYATLIFRAPGGDDHPQALDFALNWEVSYNREGDA